MRLHPSLLAAALLSGCASQPSYVPSGAPASVSAAPVKAGDFWEYRVYDVYTKIDHGLYRYEVKQADANRVVVDVTHDGQVAGTRVYAPGWNGIDERLPNVPDQLHFNPPFPAYQYPLEPGKTWYTVVNATNPVTKATYRVHTRAKVVGWERIRVPAGEFDALRVQREVFAGNSTAVKTQEEIRETDWYVPALQMAAITESSSQHFDNSMGGGDGGGEYPLRIRGDWLRGELVRYSR